MPPVSGQAIAHPVDGLDVSWGVGVRLDLAAQIAQLRVKRPAQPLVGVAHRPSRRVSVWPGFSMKAASKLKAADRQIPAHVLE